jgi:hypothetical protein
VLQAFGRIARHGGESFDARLAQIHLLLWFDRDWLLATDVLVELVLFRRFVNECENLAARQDWLVHRDGGLYRF